MKKFLTILWIIILGGSIFIGVRLFKPDSQPGHIGEINTPTTDTIIETPTNLSEKESLNYTEYINAGDKYYYEGYIEKAITNYNSAISLNSNSSQPLVRLAEAYLTNNQPSQAKEAFEKAQLLNPESIEIKLGIARSYLDLKDFENAKDIVWQLDITNYDVKYYTGVILVLYKDFEGAKTIFEEIKTLGPQTIPAANEILIAKAEKFLEKYETYSYFIQSESVYLETLLAKALTEVNEHQAAIRLIYGIIEEENNYRDAWIVLGYAYLNTNQPLDAIDALSQAKSLDPEKPETLFYLGLAYFADNDIDNAIYYIEKADKEGYEPKDQIDLKLGDLYSLKEKYNESAAKYEEVITKNPNNIDVFIKAIWINIDKLENPDKALELAQKTIQFHPEKAMSYNLAGWALTAQGEFESAENYLTQALKMEPNLDAANLNIGWLYEQQGSLTLAKEYYKKAYILGQGNSVANLAALRFNKLGQQEQEKYYRVDISAP